MCFFVAILIIQQIHMNFFFCSQSVALESIIHPQNKKRQSFRLSFCVERETGSLPHATLPVLSFGIQSTVTAHYCFFSSSGLRRCLKLAPPACYRKRVRYPVSRSTHEKRQSFRLSFCVERETGFGPATFTLAR